MFENEHLFNSFVINMLVLDNLLVVLEALRSATGFLLAKKGYWQRASPSAILFAEEKTVPNLQVIEKNGVYLVQNMDTDVCYGRYATRHEAEEALKDWRAYYELWNGTL